MNRVLVVGGNSGVGLAIVEDLLLKGIEKIYIVGKDEPDISAIGADCRKLFDEKVIFKKQNFVDFDISAFDDITDLDGLFITAGFGRVALFEELTEAEVVNLIRVDLEAAVRILKRYYKKINSTEDLYTAVMVSICGRIASPFFSVYGAAKGGLRFIIENLNCELAAKGVKNRILEVSPGALKGTNFNGKGNDLSAVFDIAGEIVERALKRETLFIPAFDEVYAEVIRRYNEDPEKFGIASYNYKVESGRRSEKAQVTIGYLSGTFDLFHIGHLNLLRRAKEQCDYLIVGVHEDGTWKGKETFIPLDERKAIVSAIKYVDKVVNSEREDADAWEKYRYDKLFVGSDYKGSERFLKYEKFFEDKNVEIVYFPYTQNTSSTQLRAAIKAKTGKAE